MSLLDKGTETVTVYPVVTSTDEDGNTITKASTTGTDYRATVQPMAVGAKAETNQTGFETVSRYRLRLVGYPGLLGPEAQVDWRGKRYAIDGEPEQHTSGSRRTWHVTYTIQRS